MSNNRTERLLDELVPAIRGLSVEDRGEGGLAWRQQSAVRGQEPAREGQRPAESAAAPEETDLLGPAMSTPRELFWYQRIKARDKSEPQEGQRPAEGAEGQEEERVREGSQSYKGVWFLGEPMKAGDWVAMEWPVKGHWQQGQVMVVLGGDAAWVRVQWQPSAEYPASRWGPHESWEARAKLWRCRVPPRVD